MNSIMIIKPDGTKYPATREQLLQLAKSGVITPDTKVEVQGRIVSARKIQNLVPIFEERERQILTRGTNTASTEPSLTELPSAPFPTPPPIDNAVPENSPPRSDIAPMKSPSNDSTTDPASTDTKADTIEERARSRTDHAIAPLNTMCGVIQFIGALTATACFGCVAVFFLAEENELQMTIIGNAIIDCIITCLALYFLHGFIRVIMYYVLKRAEDSIRQEDFNRDVMLQLKEIKERLE